MIRYNISKADIEALIEEEKPGWLARAAERTDHFAQVGEYDESSSIWAEVKPVFMRLQHEKCAYCERNLGSEKYGKIEFDLEHFRPKKKARPWKLTTKLKNAGVTITAPQQGSNDPGYHLLAYNPVNYCTSCKTCNSNLKNDHFPIEGPRNSGGSDPVALRSEKPLLINPVGDFDDDPAELIGFRGLSPMAIGNTDYKKHRGLVSIAFFKLDDHRRKDIFRERARVIVSLYSFLDNADSAESDEIKEAYESLVETYTLPSSPHTNCAACFLKLYEEDKDEAKEIFLLTTAYIKSISD